MSVCDRVEISYYYKNLDRVVRVASSFAFWSMHSEEKAHEEDNTPGIMLMDQTSMRGLTKCAKYFSLSVLLILALAIYSASHGPPPEIKPLPNGWTPHSMISADGENRSFHVYIPRATITAIVLILAGFDERGFEMCKRNNILSWAELYGFVAICPDAVGERLTHASGSGVEALRPIPHQSPANTTGMYWRAFINGGYRTWWIDKRLDTHDGSQDVRWLADELLPWVIARKPHDVFDPMDTADTIKIRTIVFGESLGGSMAFRLACERSESFDGLIIAGTSFIDPWVGWTVNAGKPQCQMSRALPSWHGNGASDFWYGTNNGLRTRMSFDTGWRDFASRAMGCTGEPRITWTSPSGAHNCSEYPAPCPTRLCAYLTEEHNPQKFMFNEGKPGPSELLGFQAAWDYLEAHAPEQLAHDPFSIIRQQR